MKIPWLVLFLCTIHQAYGNGISYIDCSDSVETIDQAKLTLQPSATAAGYQLWATNTDCYQCVQSGIGQFTTNMPVCVTLYTPFEWKLYLTAPSGQQSEVRWLFGDQGEYSASVADGSFTLSIIETKHPVDSMLPLYSLLGILGLLGIAVFTVPALYRAYLEHSRFGTTQASGRDLDTLLEQSMLPLGAEDTEQQPVNLFTAPAPVKKARLRSLDAFRGLSLMLMIFVNYGGGGYWFFNHAAWNGLTLADLLFPWFMWIMGVSMALSFVQQLPATAGYGSPVMHKALQRVGMRSGKLFLLGMFLNNGYDYTTWRIPGVLQYFAVSYLLVSLTVIAVHPWTQGLLEGMRRAAREDSQEDDYRPQQSSTRSSLCDSNIIPQAKPSLLGCIQQWFAVDAWVLSAYRYELLIQLWLLAIYLAIIFGAAAPGCPRGYNGPGGLGSHGGHPECTGGVHRYIDLMLFTNKHFYQWPTCGDLYDCISYDPEGTLGLFTATLLTYMGLMVGRILMHFPNPKQNIKLLLYFSFLLLLLCGLLCNFSQNEGIIPVNKNLWSLSFICVCGGLGIIGLAGCYLLIDIWKLWSGAPFYYLGMNSILLYMAHEILALYFPFSFIIFKESHALILTSNAVGVACWCVIAYYFYKIKFFVKV